MNKALIVAAHPDDEVLGCGGTAAKLAAAGWRVGTMILGEGITARDDVRDPARRGGEIQKLRAMVGEANAILGIRDLWFEQFPDNRFDSVDLLDLVKAVERVKRELEPTVVFTHDRGDLNVDHQRVHEAVLTATRPVADEPVQAVYAFEVLSSTEWRFPTEFRPDTYVPIEDHLSTKIEAMKCYSGELRSAAHPRSVSGIESLAALRGITVGYAAAEAFRTIRRIAGGDLSFP